MRTKVLVALLVFFAHYGYSQFNPKWERFIVPIMGEASFMQKAIYLNDSLFFMNLDKNTLYIIDGHKSTNTIPLKFNWNMIGNPFDYRDGKYYFIYSSGGIASRKALQYYQINQRLASKTTIKADITSFALDSYWGKRNRLINIDDTDRNDEGYRALMEADFIIGDSVIDLFLLDNYRLAWWRSTSSTPTNEDWEEVRTYTYLDEDDVLFRGEKSRYDLQSKYIFNSLDDIYYSYGAYTFFKVLFSFLTENEQEIILQRASREGHIQNMNTIRNIYGYINKNLPDSVIDALHSAVGVPISPRNLENRQRRIYSRFPTELRDTLMYLMDKHKEPEFFYGPFHAIQQGGNYFIISRRLNVIYHIDENRIVPIARLKGMPHKVFGGKFYIEDRDNQQLIFFSPVEWLGEHPVRPKYKVITDPGDIDRLFGIE